MTIDDAIKHCKEQVAKYERQCELEIGIEGKVYNSKCATVYKQFAEWLIELKDLRAENKVLISECDRLIKEKGELLRKVSNTEDDTNVGRKSGGWISFDRLRKLIGGESDD